MYKTAKYIMEQSHFNKYALFSYYGTKKRLSPYYPDPKFDSIIEPFAGAAFYSLYKDNWKKQVTLNDKYEKVYIVWDFLINHASVKDIKNLPDLKEGLKIDNLKISDQEKALLGFFANPASAVPKKTVTKRGEISWDRHKTFLIDNIHKVKHWKITNKNYDELKNLKATYFIDPPYQFGGEHYHSSTSNSHLNYDDLAKWCLSRNGEIIVCENDKADWLNFKPLAELNGQLHKTKEVMFHKIK